MTLLVPFYRRGPHTLMHNDGALQVSLLLLLSISLVQRALIRMLHPPLGIPLSPHTQPGHQHSHTAQTPLYTPYKPVSTTRQLFTKTYKTLIVSKELTDCSPPNTNRSKLRVWAGTQWDCSRLHLELYWRQAGLSLIDSPVTESSPPATASVCLSIGRCPLVVSLSRRQSSLYTSLTAGHPVGYKLR